MLGFATLTPTYGGLPQTVAGPRVALSPLPSANRFGDQATGMRHSPMAASAGKR
jgi:hypothetical protein